LIDGDRIINNLDNTSSSSASGLAYHLLKGLIESFEGGGKMSSVIKAIMIDNADLKGKFEGERKS